MKTLYFTRKTLLELWRSPQVFWLYLLFPAMMVLIYYSAFGQNPGMANYLTILIENNDRGSLGEQLSLSIRAAEFDGKPAFTVMEGFTPNETRILLNEGKAALLIRIPENFSAALLDPVSEPAEVELVGDPLSDTFVFSQSFLAQVLREFSSTVTGWEKDLPVSLEFLPNTGTLNDFQVGLPGLVIFGIMFGVITNALLLTRERSDGTLQRIRLSKAHAAHFLGGVTLAGFLLSLLQMGITFGLAAAVGFIPVGQPWLVGLIGTLAGLSAAGLGFICACFAKNEGEATAIGTALMVPLVFLSGSIFPLPKMTILRLFGQPVQPYDLMPSTHAAQAMSKVVLYGAKISDLGYELISLTLLTLVVFSLGIFLYQKRVLTYAERS